MIYFCPLIIVGSKFFIKKYNTLKSNLIIFSFLCSIFILSCTKPEEKIRGQWQISKVYKNKVETLKETPSNVEAVLSIWTFYRSSIVVMKYYEQNTLYETSGNWTIDKKNNQLSVTFTDLYENIKRIYRINVFEMRIKKPYERLPNKHTLTLHIPRCS